MRNVYCALEILEPLWTVTIHPKCYHLISNTWQERETKKGNVEIDNSHNIPSSIPKTVVQ